MTGPEQPPTKGHTFERQSDGSVVTYDANGQPVQQVMPDGRVYSSFDDAGRARYVEIPPSDGQAATYAHIGYQDNLTIFRYSDKSVLTFDSHSQDLVSQRLPDGTLYTDFNANDQPQYVEIPARSGQPATSAEISYVNGNTVYTYADDTVITYNADGKMLKEQRADGTTYSDFDADNRPGHIDVPATEGRPATSAEIDYQGGNTVYTYADDSVVTYNADGKILSEQRPDGTTYSDFDASNRPGHIDVPATEGRPATSADISYEGGNTLYTYADDTVITYNADGKMLKEQRPDGTTYSDFDADNRPGHIDVPATEGRPATSADITYQDGNTLYTYADDTVITYNSGGKILTEERADGTTYSQFDADNRPHYVDIPATEERPGVTATISYRDGNTVYTYDDESVVTYDSEGQILTEDRGDGWVITYKDGAPTSGVNSETRETVTITPTAGGGFQWTYSGGTTIFRNSDGAVTSMEQNGWTFTTFDSEGRPTYGTQGTKTVTIEYGSSGSDIKWAYTDNGKPSITVITNADGTPITQINPDGSQFTFAVELDKLADAAKKIATERDALEGKLNEINKEFRTLRDYWMSPAGKNFALILDQVDGLSGQVRDVLNEAIRRMKHTHTMYTDVEEQNTKNLTSNKR
ncbi:WXG100 family type VII secretion target [Verrucosispora sp. SN26_14.1]|uniref:WXG100 family type VII secretion target n=1 Tax=Verrucosispora sp. SN26_14.1 TaxID=2527879 RepID=UPI0010352712|nr:WXG100 family type VII secretion target [Verrucosispora sp. SN26_14.1]TBL30218.1 WXG100 family type VII secretion target [Verrucosispora sp. SN26_14.1]